MAVIEKQLPPIDPGKPKSSGFDPKMFEAVKSGAIIKDEEPAVAKSNSLPKEPSPGFEEPIPLVKVIKDPDEVKAPELTKKQLEARAIVDAMEAEQKLEEEKRKKDAEARKQADKGEKKEEDDSGLLKKEEEDVEDDQPPTLKALQVQRKDFKKPLTEEEELAKFDAESLPFAKKMDRSARQWVLSQLTKKDKEIEKARKEAGEKRAEGVLPDSYYLHDKAYMLDPQYEQSIGVLQQASAELAYWEKQFAAIRSGEKEWDDLQRTQDGQYRTIKREANAASETELIKRINHANSLVTQHQGMLNYLATNYKTKVAGAMESVRKVEDEFFPQFSKDESLKGHKYYEPIQALLSQKGMSSLVPSSLFQKLFLHSQDQQEYIAELEEIAGKAKEAQENAVVEDEDSEAEVPPPKITSKAFKGGETGKTKNVDKGFDPSAFEKLKRARGY